MICKSTVLIMHNYDIGDQGVFVEVPYLTIEQVKDLAVYLEFTAEKTDESYVVANIVIAQFLEKFGAKILQEKPKKFHKIDMFFEREDRCGTWYHQDYEKYNQKYGVLANTFLKEKNII